MERPLFDCAKCQRCCHGEFFEHPSVYLSRDEEATHARRVTLVPLEAYNLPSAHFKSLPVIPDPDLISRCVYYDKDTRVCSVYGEHPLDCQIFPFRLIGNNLVINSICPDSLQFEQRWKRGEPAAVAHVNKVLARLQKIFDDGDWTFGDMFRHDSYTTDNLTVFGRINDPETENWLSIEECHAALKEE